MIDEYRIAETILLFNIQHLVHIYILHTAISRNESEPARLRPASLIEHDDGIDWQ